MPELDGRIALVTGGSRGIGAAICAELGAAGATVVVNYVRDESAAAAVSARVRDAGGRAEGVQGDAGQTNYAASKAGLIGLTKSLAKELGGRGIRVNAIAPGYIATELTDALPEEARTAILGNTPLGRLGEPDDVARAVRFLVSDAAGFITGDVLAVDGGLGM